MEGQTKGRNHNASSPRNPGSRDRKWHSLLIHHATGKRRRSAKSYLHLHATTCQHPISPSMVRSPRFHGQNPPITSNLPSRGPRYAHGTAFCSHNNRSRPPNMLFKSVIQFSCTQMAAQSSAMEFLHAQLAKAIPT